MDLLDAVYANDNEEVLELLESGMDPNFQSFDEDDGGLSPLMWATLNGNEKNVKLLLFYGANPFLENSEGDIAIDLLDHPQFEGGEYTHDNIYRILEKSMIEYELELEKKRQQQELIHSKQRLSLMKGMNDPNSMLKYLREPNLMENIGNSLSTMKTQDNLKLRMSLEDKEREREEREREERENELITNYLKSIEQVGGKFRFKR